VPIVVNENCRLNPNSCLNFSEEELSKLSIHDVTALTELADGYVPSNHAEQDYQKLKALADLALNQAQAAYWNTKGINASHAFIVVGSLLHLARPVDVQCCFGQ
jgi:hypothetical protein